MDAEHPTPMNRGWKSNVEVQEPLSLRQTQPVFLRKSRPQIITAKLKLTTTPEQFAALRQTQLAYRDALNAVSQYAFEQGKISNVTKLHKGMYTELRTRHHLPSQLACSVERQVAATYKGLWTKLKKNAEHRHAKITKKRFKGLDKPPTSSSPTVQYTYERDYTFQCESRVSIGTLNARISVAYQGYDKHMARIRQGATIGDAKLWYDRQKKTRIIRVFQLKDFEPMVSHSAKVDIPPTILSLTLCRSELIRRLNAGQCEYCGIANGPFEVHHIRKMKDVAHGKTAWQKLMAARNRKTLILCLNCHHLLHAGKLPDREHRTRQVKGEPDALKGARPVLREGDG